jgi:hypothetical protein
MERMQPSLSRRAGSLPANARNDGQKEKAGEPGRRLPRGERHGAISAACALDLEGIVAKPKRGSYGTSDNGSRWFKVRNPHYSQKEGREELFEERMARST